MIEDEIRTSLDPSNKEKYAANGLSPQDGNGQLERDEKASTARRAIWKEGQPPGDIPAAIGAALKYAEENIENRRVFLDALHRVFLEAASNVECRGDEVEPVEDPLFKSVDDPIDYSSRPRLKGADRQKTAKERKLAVKNESRKLRQHPERQSPVGFSKLRAM